MSTVTLRFIYAFKDSHGQLQFVENNVSVENLEWDYENNNWDDSQYISMVCTTFAPYEFVRTKQLSISTKFKKDKLFILVNKFKFELTMGLDNILYVKMYQITGDGDWCLKYKFDREFPDEFGDCELYTLTETELDLP